MRICIQYQAGMKYEQLTEAGFDCIEYRYTEEAEEHDPIEDCGCPIAGLTVSPEMLRKAGFAQVLHRTLALAASYLVIETVGIQDGAVLYAFLEPHLEEIRRSGVRVYIENGYHRRSGGQMVRDDFSESSMLNGLIDQLNLQSQGASFGICFHVGHANLLSQNAGAMIEEFGSRIALLHACDNDGIHDFDQLPYTFTKGRGELVTDWYGMIGTLARCHFHGSVVFSLTGLFCVSPQQLHPVWYELLVAIGQEWKQILELDIYLAEKDCRILFGAGRMFRNYMKVWGEEYPPIFTVDNNRELWGEKQLGIEIRSPQAILEYTKEERNVFLCNMYYEPMERQLAEMGIESKRYNNQYFFRQEGIEA